MSLLLALRLISAAAFLYYGIRCLSSAAMIAEFERYGLPRMRVLTAILEIVGALGLLLAPTHHWVIAAAGGLCALMFAGLIVRMRISDPWYLMLPAFVLMLLNGWIVVKAWRSGAS
ncbi:MAG: hypothetical protein FJ285_06815 [Planctomycetes bacterium]|nr:hypothetical protein [Planctomycetota bacterium]